MASQGAKKESGMMDLIIPFVAVTLIGGGGGWFLGFSLLAPKEAAKTETDKPQGAQNGLPGKEENKETGKAAHADASGHGNASGHGDSSGHGDTEAHAQGHDKEVGAAPAESLEVKELPPIVTNLAANKSWVRLQTAIVFDPKELSHSETLIPELMSDLTAFMNTLDLRDVEGPDGLRRLREELNERALIRSDRHVRELVVESLVIQ